jgi:hypothetical protein
LYRKVVDELEGAESDLLSLSLSGVGTFYYAQELEG